jgi:hypothetical protein
MKTNENFSKFSDICRDFSVFIFVFQDYYWNPKVEDSSCKIDESKTKSKTKMGVEGVIFESHPPNFENLYNF